jgi:hypothetical protein
MRKKWQRVMSTFVVRVLQITILIGILFYINQIVLGFSPAPDLVDIISLSVLVLLGMIILSLNWVLFEVNKVEERLKLKNFGFV